jgi:hypothetical protein
MYVSNSDSRTPTLIQAVPGLTAQPYGVADYALRLARALRAYNGVNTISVLGPASVHGKVRKTILVRVPNFVADAIQASTASVLVVQEISGRSSVRLKQQEMKS